MEAFREFFCVIPRSNQYEAGAAGFSLWVCESLSDIDAIYMGTDATKLDDNTH